MNVQSQVQNISVLADLPTKQRQMEQAMFKKIELLNLTRSEEQLKKLIQQG